MPATNLDTTLSIPANRSLAYDIAKALRAAILSGHFEPGERLGEEAIARSMGVSRGPVREALSQLAREGLVIIRRNRGAIVAQLSRDDLEEVYTLRVPLERLAIRRAATYATEPMLARIQTTVDRIAAMAAREITEQEAAELDIEFHDHVFQAARHRRLYECWITLRPQIHILLLNRNVAHPDFRDYAVTAHQQILDAVRARDEALAVRLTEAHLRGSYERVVRSYEQQANENGMKTNQPERIGELVHGERSL